MEGVFEETGPNSGMPVKEGRLLLRRIVAMGLSAEAIASCEPEIFQHLEGTCAACDFPELCASGLRDFSAARNRLSASLASLEWDDYCSNAVLLSGLSELSWFRSNPIT